MTLEIANFVISLIALTASFLIPCGVSVAFLVRHISKSDCWGIKIETRPDRELDDIQD